MKSILFFIFFIATAAIGAQIYHDPTNPLSNRANPYGVRWLFGTENGLSEENKRVVCETDECQLIAKILKSSMNESVDPCEDFYEYACGKWPESDLRPQDSKLPYSLWSLAERETAKRIKHIEDYRPTADDPLFVRSVHKFYDTCMDTSTLEKVGLEPLVNTLLRIGGWPIIMEPDEWSEKDYTWQKVDDFYARLDGHYTFFEIDTQGEKGTLILAVEPPVFPKGLSKLFGNESCEEDSREKQGGSEETDDEVEKIHSINLKKKTKLKTNDAWNFCKTGENSMGKIVDQDNVHLVRKLKESSRKGRRYGQGEAREESKRKRSMQWQYEARQRKKYASFITEVALSVAEAQGKNISRENIERDSVDLVKFAVDLYRIGDVRAQVNLPVRTFLDLQIRYNKFKPKRANAKINWMKKLSNLLDEANIEVSENTRIRNSVERYLQKLVGLLDRTPSKTIVNYIHWNFVSKALAVTTKKMMDLLDDWIPKEEKENTYGDRMKWCADISRKSVIVNYQFATKFFKDETKKEAEELMRNIKKAVELEVTESEWLDEKTKIESLEKVKAMKSSIAFPEWLRNVTVMNDLFSGFVIGPSFFENYFSSSRVAKWKTLRVTLEDFSSYKFYIDITEINAGYGMNTNDIDIPAAILQNPFFGVTRPIPVNYGTIGHLMGHEANHGFDPMGIHFDKTGQRTEWPSAMAKEYASREKCYIQQFNNYVNQFATNETFKDYGKQTLNENICDSLGLEACYKAMKNAQRESGKPEATLPGFEKFTSDQLFFLSSANLWCLGTKEMFPDRAEDDSHSVGRFRVWGYISNSNKFAEAFNCAPGTPMNPTKKCDIWH